MVLSMNPIKKESTKQPLPSQKSSGVPLCELATQERNRPTDSQIRMKDEAKLNRRSPVADEVGAGDTVEISSESSKRTAARPKALLLQKTKAGFEKKLLTEARGLYKMLQDTPTSAAESVSSQLPQNNNSAMSNPQAKTGTAIDQLPNICTPGSYFLALKFTGFEVRVKSNVESKWVLVVYHPPFVVSERRQTCLIAKPKMSDDGNKSKFSFEEGWGEAEWELMIPETGKENLETLLEMRFSTERDVGKHMAFAQIQLGNSLFTKLQPSGRKLQGTVGIYAMKASIEKTVKIGYLGYDFTLRQGGEHTANIMLESPSVRPATPSRFEDHGRVEKPVSSDKPRMPDSDGWKSQKEQLFRPRVELQEKERDYFQVLSMEHKKQMQESEKAVREKTYELETMKKQYTDKLKEIAAKEEHRKLLEAQLTKQNQAKVYDLTKERDDLTYMCRILEHDKKLEVGDLGKRLDDASNVAEVAQSRIRALETNLKMKDAKIAELTSEMNKSEQAALSIINLVKQEGEGLLKRLYDALNATEVCQSLIRALETKLEMKDAKIAQLTSEKNKSPEQEALRKIDLLEQKITQLGRDLAEALYEKEHYLAHSKQLAQAEEMQALLRIENEELKLQMQSAHQQQIVSSFTVNGPCPTVNSWGCN